MVHEILLMGYVEEWTQPNTGLISDQCARWIDSICHMDSAYLTTARVWQKVFQRATETKLTDADKKKVLGVVYEKWRRLEETGEARKEWMSWVARVGSDD
jgi:hypothetical protein